MRINAKSAAGMGLRRALASLLIVAIVCLGWSDGSAAENLLRRGNSHEPTTLDPHKINSVLDFNAILDLFEGLTAFTSGDGVEPAVAQSWTTSPDGKTWTFTLRPGLKWSDGSPLTAEDVVYSFRRLLDPATAAPFASIAYGIVNARAVNAGKRAVSELGVASPRADTVVLSLEHPTPYLPMLLARANLVVVPRAAIAKFPDEWMRPGHAVSNGAFALKAWVPNSHVRLERNPHFRVPPVLDAVIYEPTSDLEAAVTQFRAGGLDMQYNFPATQLAPLQRDMPRETKASLRASTTYLLLNVQHPKLADGRVRQALSLAIDRDVMTARVLRGGQVPTHTFIPPGFAGYRAPEWPEHAGTMAERLKRAKALLMAAGISPESPLRLVFSYSSSVETKRVAIALAAMWKPLGIILVLENLENKVMMGNLSQGNYEISYAGWRAEYPDPLSFLGVLLSTTNNIYSRYRNPAYDDLVARGAQTVDLTERHKIFRDAELMMLKDQPIIPLHLAVNRQLVSTRVRGWEPNPEGVHLSRYLSIDHEGGP